MTTGQEAIAAAVIVILAGMFTGCMVFGVVQLSFTFKVVPPWQRKPRTPQVPAGTAVSGEHAAVPAVPFKRDGQGRFVA